MLGFPTFQHLQDAHLRSRQRLGSVEDVQGVMDVGDLEHCPPEEPEP